MWNLIRKERRMKETLCLISNCVLNRVDLYKEYEVEKWNLYEVFLVFK